MSDMPIMKTLMGYEIYDEAARTAIDELENNTNIKFEELESGKADAIHTHSADDITEGSVPVKHGGTGGTTVAEARDNLGLGNTDGAVPVANGGTGAADRVTALHNLGIYWGEDSAEDYWNSIENGDELKKNTIYIQIN